MGTSEYFDTFSGRPDSCVGLGLRHPAGDREEGLLLGQPDGVELIVEVVAGRARAPAHAGGVRRDSVPLERVEVVALLVEETLLEVLDVSPALLGIHGATLPDVEVVQHGIGIPAV